MQFKPWICLGMSRHVKPAFLKCSIGSLWMACVHRGFRNPLTWLSTMFTLSTAVLCLILHWWKLSEMCWQCVSKGLENHFLELYNWLCRTFPMNKHADPSTRFDDILPYQSFSLCMKHCNSYPWVYIPPDRTSCTLIYFSWYLVHVHYRSPASVALLLLHYPTTLKHFRGGVVWFYSYNTWLCTFTQWTHHEVHCGDKSHI